MTPKDPTRHIAILVLHGLWWGAAWQPWSRLTLEQERGFGFLAAPASTPDPTMSSLGLPWHPAPRELGREVRRLAQLLDGDLATALRVAPLLAARGWPGATLGDGARSSDTTTSVERAAGVTQDVKPTDIRTARFTNVDRRLASLLAVIHQATTEVTRIAGDVLAHASDVDLIPPGTGGCQCCSRFCRPTAEQPDNRLRAGFCPACWKAWGRAGRPERGPWMIERRQQLAAAVRSGKAPAEVVADDDSTDVAS